jgi:predicted nucleic acid-binding protein
MAKSREAYVDTSALIALVDRSDTHHPLFKRLFSAPPRLVTTSLVIAEGHAWFLRRFDQSRALQFLAMIEAMTPLAILPVGQPQLTAALSLLRKFSDQELTLTDAMGLHCMQSRRIGTCWSTDFHLGLTGVPLVIQLAQ